MRDAGELQILALGKRVAYLDGAVVVQADDVARHRLLHQLPLAGLERHRVGDFHVLAQAHVAHFHALAVTPGAHPQKGDPVPMAGVHIGLDLEHKAAEDFLIGGHGAVSGIPRLRRRRPLDEVVEHLTHAKIAQRGAEKHRAEFPRQERCLVKLVAGTPDQLDLFQESIVLIAQQGAGLRAGKALDTPVIRQHRALAGGVLVDHIGVEVVDPFEQLAHTDGPVDRRPVDGQHLLDLVQQVDRVADVPVHFVDEAEDWGIAQAAHVHQLDGAVLHPLGPVDHHQGRIDRRQRAVGIFGEILVAGGVQQVYRTPAIGKLHHRGGHRDAALLLHAHPVGSGVRAFLALDAASHLDRITQQQQFFGDRGLARIGVRDNGEGAPRSDLSGKVWHGTTRKKARIIRSFPAARSPGRRAPAPKPAAS